MKNKFVLALAAALLLAGCVSYQSIQVDSPPAKTVYGQGQDLSLAGLSVSGITTKGETRTLSVTSAQISGYNKHQVGEQNVVVTAGGKQTYFTVQVVPLLSINMETPPTKLHYRKGLDTKLDLTGLTVSATWDTPIGKNYYDVSNLTQQTTFNPNLAGVQTIVLTAEGKQLNISVNVVSMQTLAIQVQPTKTMYKVGEALNLSGIVLEGTWEGIGAYQIPVSSVQVSGYEPAKSGQQTVNLTMDGKTATFKVVSVPLSSIRIVAPPVKSRYMKGESLVLTGLEVWGTWEGIGSEKLSIDADHVSGFDSTSLGVKTLTVRAEEKTATFNISVMGLSTMRILNYPKISYYQGESLDMTGILVMGNYTDTISTVEQNVPVTVANVSGYLPSRLGVQTLTISVDNVYTTFPVTVQAAPAVSETPSAQATVETPPEKTLVSIAIDYAQVTKWVYIAGESFDLSTVPVTGWYSDGTTANVNLAANGATFTGFDSRTLGWKDVVIKIGSLQTFPLRVTVAQSGWDQAK